MQRPRICSGRRASARGRLAREPRGRVQRGDVQSSNEVVISIGDAQARESRLQRTRPRQSLVSRWYTSSAFFCALCDSIVGFFETAEDAEDAEDGSNSCTISL